MVSPSNHNEDRPRSKNTHEPTTASYTHHVGSVDDTVHISEDAWDKENEQPCEASPQSR